MSPLVAGRVLLHQPTLVRPGPAPVVQRRKQRVLVGPLAPVLRPTEVPARRRRGHLRLLRGVGLTGRLSCSLSKARR